MKKLLCISLTLVAACLVYQYYFSADPQRPAPYPEEEKMKVAYNVSQSFVLKRIATPSTAVFPPFDDKMIRKESKDIYLVRSYVDAHNVFGALTRRTYYCEVRYDAANRNHEWKLVRLAVEE